MFFFYRSTSTKARTLDPKRRARGKTKSPMTKKKTARTKEATKRNSKELTTVSSNILIICSILVPYFLPFTRIFNRDAQDNKSETESEGSQQTGKDFEMVEKEEEQ